MKQYFVYILLCNDGSYYTGITNDIERRLYEHENGIDPKSHTYKRPVKLIFYERFIVMLIRQWLLKSKLKVGKDLKKKH